MSTRQHSGILGGGVHVQGAQPLQKGCDWHICEGIVEITPWMKEKPAGVSGLVERETP